jgi:ABC-type branched-subunit amino acid transport system ATPase component
MQAVIQIKDLNKQFGGIVVADQIGLEVHAGEILGLIGPNGAGKTSLFNLISGLYMVDSGEILLDGKSLAGMSTVQRARQGIARTWQHMRLFPSMSVLENLCVATRNFGAENLLNLVLQPSSVKKEQEVNQQKALDTLKRMQLYGVAHSSIGDLTFGQQKLVGLARALMNDGKCLLLDEPMAGVEGAAYETIKDIVREEALSGRAICVVEHNISFVKDLCSTAIFMANGKILERGTVDDLLASKTLETLYFGGAAT